MIWEIKDSKENKIKSFQENVKDEKWNFKKYSFREPHGRNIGEIMNIMELVPSLINKDMNGRLEGDVRNEDILVVIRKWKSSRPDGLTM